jgi:hypothetical protein
MAPSSIIVGVSGGALYSGLHYSDFRAVDLSAASPQCPKATAAAMPASSPSKSPELFDKVRTKKGPACTPTYPAPL